MDAGERQARHEIRGDVTLVARAELSEDVFLISSPELKTLADSLRQGERVLRVVVGSHGWKLGLLALTTERLLFAHRRRLLGILPAPSRTHPGFWTREISYSDMSAM